MKAAVWYGYKDIRIEEVAKPKAGPGKVIIKVAFAGICGTDRHEYVGPNFIPVSKPHRLTGRTAPLIIGHEFTGEISEIGEGVTGYKIGDRVTANGTLCDKVCPICRSGRYNVCEKLGFLGVSTDGGFAEYVEVEAARLFRIPDSLSLRDAALAEPLSCGIHATKIMGGVKGADVVIIGPGIIGLGAFFAAKHDGASKILMAGVGKDRQALIEQYGGSYVDVSKEDLSEHVREWSGGKNADVVYECVGLQNTLDNAIKVLKPTGRLMEMGVFEKPPLFPINDFQEGERTLYTSQANLDEIADALKRLDSGEIRAKDLITREVTLDNLVQDGFEELLENGPKHIKILIKISGNL